MHVSYLELRRVEMAGAAMKKDEERPVMVQGRVTEAERKQLRVLCVERGISQWDAVGDAVRQLLARAEKSKAKKGGSRAAG